jgi:hypothetical protein
MRDYGQTNAAPYASAPAVGAAGDTYWNTTSKILYVSDGTAWLAPSAAVGDGSITTAKLADAPNSVTTAKVSDLAITDAKIAAMAASKLTGTVAQARLPVAPSGLATANLNDGAVTLAKLALAATVRNWATTPCVETLVNGATPVVFATLTLTVGGGFVVISGELVGSLHDSGTGYHWVEVQLLRGAGILRRWLVPVQNPGTQLVGMAFPVHYNEIAPAGSVTYKLQALTDPAVYFRADLFAGANRAGFLTAVEYA